MNVQIPPTVQLLSFETFLATPFWCRWPVSPAPIVMENLSANHKMAQQLLISEKYHMTGGTDSWHLTSRPQQCSCFQLTRFSTTLLIIDYSQYKTSLHTAVCFRRVSFFVYRIAMSELCYVQSVKSIYQCFRFFGKELPISCTVVPETF